jgi:hypothetical protein
MRLPLTPGLLVCVVAASGCFISEDPEPARTCAQDADCPSTHRCVTVTEGERTCEVLYPPAPLDFDAGGVPDAGPLRTPTWCNDIQPVMAAHCVSACHGATTSGSGHPEFRLDVYSSASPKGALEMAARIKARAVDQANMPPGAPPTSLATERDLIKRWVAAGSPFCDDAGTP